MVIEISERIKELREAKSMSQTALAKELNISRTAVNAWEMGISLPSMEKLIELSKIFNVSADYLLGIENKVTIKLDSLSDEQINVILDLVNILSKSNNQ